MRYTTLRHNVFIFLPLFITLAAILTVISGANAHAAGCGGVDTSIINCDEQDGSAIWSLLLIVVNVLTGLVGVAAIGGFVYAAILYTSAGDKSAQVTKAKETFANVAIGLVLFALTWAFIQFLIPGGVFKDYSTPTISSTPSASNNSQRNSGGGNANGSSASAKTPKLKNFRDASASTSGSVLKKGVLYRSVDLSAGNLKGNNVDKLSSTLGKNALIIDVRMGNKRTAEPDQKIKNATNTHIPIQGFTNNTQAMVDGGPNASATARSEAKTRREQLKKVLLAAANAKGSVLLHCWHGKDRTGWAIAMIMHISGASYAQIKKEYMISQKAFPEVKASNLQAGFDRAKAAYGSINGYLKNGVGLTNADIQKIRNKFKA